MEAKNGVGGWGLGGGGVQRRYLADWGDVHTFRGLDSHGLPPTPPQAKQQ